MRAIRVGELGGPEVLKIETVDDPVAGPGEVVVRMEAVGVNFIEIYFRKGLYKTPLPFTPGSEGAGTVVAVGDGVERLHVGDRVASQSFRGSYAELSLLEEGRAVVLPDGVSTRHGAALMLQGMTAHYLTTSVYRLAQNDWCLVHAAAGGVGLLLCQIGKLVGARVIGTVSTQEKAELARKAGAQEVIRYTEEDFVESVRRITNGEGVRVVYDSVGATTFLKSMECLRSRGMLALFGQSSGPVAPFDPALLNKHGSLFLTRPTLAHYAATPEELAWRAQDLFKWMKDDQLSLRVDRELPLELAAEAHRALEGRETKGKVLLTTGS